MLYAEIVVNSIKKPRLRTAHTLSIPLHAVNVDLGRVFDWLMVDSVIPLYEACSSVQRTEFSPTRTHTASRLVVAAVGLQRYSFHAPTALREADDGAFADGPASGLEPAALMLVGFLAANVGFIGLDYAAQEAASPPLFIIIVMVIAASRTKTLQHEPRRLLRNADSLGQLKGRYALASSNEQINGVQPLV